MSDLPAVNDDGRPMMWINCDTGEVEINKADGTKVVLQAKKSALELPGGISAWSWTVPE